MLSFSDLAILIDVYAGLIGNRLADVITWAALLEPIPGNLLRLWQSWMINKFLGIE